MLSVIIKALLGERESHGCYCLFCPRREPQQSATALLIGTAEHQRQLVGGQASRSNHTYISQLKQHLTQQKVEIFSCQPKYHGSRNDLHQLISNFFSRSDPSLFILYYSGPTDAKGNWSISTTEIYEEKYEDIIRLDTIVSKWKAAKSDSNRHLIVILDAPNSEKWLQKVKRYEAEANITITASSGSDSGNTSGTLSLGQYTQSLIGSQGHGFYPKGAQEMIRTYLARDPTSTNGLLCYICGTCAYYKQ